MLAKLISVSGVATFLMPFPLVNLQSRSHFVWGKPILRGTFKKSYSRHPRWNYTTNRYWALGGWLKLCPGCPLDNCRRLRDSQTFIHLLGGTWYQTFTEPLVLYPPCYSPNYPSASGAVVWRIAAPGLTSRPSTSSTPPFVDEHIEIRWIISIEESSHFNP